MILLAIDTSTSRAALALARPGQPPRVAPAEPDPGHRHGRGLVPAIAELLRLEGLTARDLGAVAVGLGPGSYTGLRIGLTAAKVIAYASKIPLIGLDSLEAIARNAPDDALTVNVLADAQRGDVYLADFAREGPGAPLARLGPTRIVPFGPWASTLGPGTMVLGPSLDRLPAEWPEGVVLGSPDQGHPTGNGLASLAFDRLDSSVDPFFVEPTYLRRSAAEDQWERLGR